MDLQNSENDLYLILHKAQNVFAEGRFPEAEALYESALRKAEALLEQAPGKVSFLAALRDAREGFVLSFENNPEDLTHPNVVPLGLLFEEVQLDQSQGAPILFLQSLEALLFLTEHLYVEEKEALGNEEERQTLLLIQDKIARSLPLFREEKDATIFRVYQDAIGAYRILFEGKEDDFLLVMSNLSTTLFSLSKIAPRCPILSDGKLSMIRLYNLLEKRKGQEESSRPEWLTLIRLYLGEKINAEA